MIKQNYYAFLAGVCACGAGLFAKLSGHAYEVIGMAASGICLTAMVCLNVIMWSFFTKSLKISSTSLAPTIVSAATNYLLSGFLGIIMFNEKTCILWWSGTSLILIGLLLIMKGNTKFHDS